MFFFVSSWNQFDGRLGAMWSSYMSTQAGIVNTLKHSYVLVDFRFEKFPNLEQRAFQQVVVWTRICRQSSFDDSFDLCGILCHS